MHTAALILFAILWITIVYFLNCLIARRILSINMKQAIIYVSTMALLGVCGEIFVGSVYHWIFAKQLWQYELLSIHTGYTSYYAPVIWGILGFYLYLLHTTLKKRRFSDNKLAMLFAAETLVLELSVNLSFLILFGKRLFYYLPSDLWHLTSVQALPFYLLAGYVLTRTIKRFQKDWLFFSLMSWALIGLLIFLTD